MDKESFVLQVSFTKNDMGLIIWCSNNAENILDIDNKMITSFMIRKIMPRCVVDLHGKMMNDFFNSGFSKVLNVPLDMYALDS